MQFIHPPTAPTSEDSRGQHIHRPPQNRGGERDSGYPCEALEQTWNRRLDPNGNRRCIGGTDAVSDALIPCPLLRISGPLSEEPDESALELLCLSSLEQVLLTALPQRR